MLSASISLESRFVGAYLGLAIGDALGASVEFMTPNEIRHQFGVHQKIIGGGWLNLKAGQVTDDTTMALALGGAILEDADVNAFSIADAFSQWLRNKPVDVGNTVRRGIVHYRNSGQPVSPENEYDAGNGACMRCLPIALHTFGQAREDVQMASRLQAHITHHNKVSDAGTECIIFLVQMALQGTTKPQMLAGPVAELLLSYPCYVFRDKKCDNPSAYIVDTLRAVFQSIFDTDDFETCLIDVVNRGGDADTTGTIAGMLAGGLYGVEAIPAAWLKSLNSDIRAACEYQAREFYARYCNARSEANGT